MIRYKILRLRSGEDIITKICGKKNGKYILERPMQMKVSSFIDSGGGLGRKDILMMRNWLQYTNQNKIDIPIDWVASILTPDNKAVIAYNNAKEREDCNPPDEECVSYQEENDEEGGEEKKNIAQSINNNIEPGSVVVTLAIPPMLFFHLLAQGLLSGNGMEGIEDDEEAGPGNNYSDWSPNVDDYFDDED